MASRSSSRFSGESGTDSELARQTDRDGEPQTARPPEGREPAGSAGLEGNRRREERHEPNERGLTRVERTLSEHWPEFSTEEIQQLACAECGLAEAVRSRFKLTEDEAGEAVLEFLRDQPDDIRDALTAGSKMPDPLEHRTPEWPVETYFVRRWSPRAMSGEAISNAELMTMLEAARWAPSTYNEQEWRYLYAHRDSEHWDTFFSLWLKRTRHGPTRREF